MELRAADDYATPWGVFDGEDEKTVHVAPMFGRRHEWSDGCWCHPERDKLDSDVVVHNVEH